MSVMDRRLQILLDASRFERVASEAHRSGRSVAAVIREAIDVCYPAGDDERIRVAGDLFRRTATPRQGRGEGPAEMKAALEQAMTEKLPIR